MDARSVARVLAKAAAFDQRTVGDGDLLAWFEAIGDLDVDDALAAVTVHYRDTADRLMPAHVRRIVADLDRDRRRAAREAAEAAEQLAIDADPTRRERSPEVAELLAELRDKLPPTDPAKVHRPEVLEWDRTRRRALRAIPNPDYDPDAAARLAAQSTVEDAS